MATPVMTRSCVKRLDLSVGYGDWKDTDTVATEVKVKFALLLEKS